jgi:hypothetical protein
VTAAGAPPWPPTYQGRLRALEDQREALRAVLGPLRDAVRAFHALGAIGAIREQEGDVAHGRWPMPAGAVLVVRAGYDLHTDVGEIARGVVPTPDPMVCLASALCTPELWNEAMVAFRRATDWAVKQAAEYGLE